MAQQREPAGDRPNVLFILSDQHQAALAGYAGHPVVRTPNLDRLAAEGVVFRNAVCNNTICTPSRMCFLSGQYCHNHGYYGLDGPFPLGSPAERAGPEAAGVSPDGPRGDGLPSMLSHARAQGYRTGAVGKIHCPRHWIEAHADVFVEAANASVGGSPEYEAYLRERNLLHLRDDRRYPEADGMSLDGRPSSLAYEDTVDAWIGRRSIDFMEESVDAGRPFFLHMSFPHPHQVYAPAKEFWDLYPPETVELPPRANRSLEGKAPHLRRMAADFRTGGWTLFEPRTHEAGLMRKLRGYYGVISQVDRAVGEVVDRLERIGALENTIIVYSSDHGEYAGRHGIVEKAPGICSDAVTRIPMLWRLPGKMRNSAAIPAGGRSDELFESVDVSATICELCDLPPMPSSDGSSRAGLLSGASASKRGAAPGKRVAITEAPWSRALTDGRFRMVIYPRAMFPTEYPEGFGELYDLETDPDEMRNLFFDPDYRDTVRRLKDELLDRLLTTTRPVTVLPEYPDTPVPTAELERRARSASALQNYL